MRKKFFGYLILLQLLSSTIFGGVWQQEIVDSTGNEKGYYCSIAIDSQNMPHITYLDPDFYDLRYAYKEDGVWKTSIIDSTGYVGFHSSIVLDDQDRPHIAYQRGYYIAAVTDVGLKYATLTDTGWAVSYVDSTRYGTVELFSSIAINKYGNIGISYIDNMKKRIKFAWKRDSTWTIVDVDSADAGASMGFSKLVFKSDGTPVIGYLYNFLKIASMTVPDSSWTTTSLPYQLITFPPSQEFNMDIDSQDNIHMTYLGIPYSIKYVHYDWSTFNQEVVYPELTGNVSLKIDNNDKPSLVLADSDIHFYTREDTGWSRQVIDEEVVTYSYSSLQFDNANNPQVTIQAKPNYSKVDKALLYYRYQPGNPQIIIPDTSHNFSTVWIQSYADWQLPIINSGDGALIINDLIFQAHYDDFEVLSADLPLYIQPGDTAHIVVRFQPQQEKNYSNVLEVHSNDNQTPVVTINLTGEGVSSGNSGNLSLTVNNAYFDLSSGYIKEDIPVKNAQVSIFQNASLVSGPHSTPDDGVLNLEDLPTGNLEIMVESDYMIPEANKAENLVLKKYFEIGPGANSYSVTFPESLFVYKCGLIDSLTHIETDFFGIPYYYTYRDSEDDIVDLLRLWGPDLPSEIIENIGRLILTEQMLYELFDDATSVGNEAMADLGDLIGFIFYADNWGASIIQLLIAIVESIGNASELMMEILNFFMGEIIKAQIMQLVSFTLDQVTALLNDEAEAIIREAWHQVKSEYGGLMAGATFGDDGWAEAKRVVYKILKIPFYQSIYIDMMTCPVIDKAYNYSKDVDYNSNFHEAYLEQKNFISYADNHMGNMKQLASGLRISANLLMVSANIFDWLGSIIPGMIGEILSQASLYMKISAYVNVVTAFGVASGEFFYIPQEIKGAVKDIYFPEGQDNLAKSLPSQHLPRAPLSQNQRLTLQKKLLNSVSAYDSTLTEIKTNINTGHTPDALRQLYDLKEVENSMMTSFVQVSSPVYSVAHEAQDSVTDFSELYDSLMAYGAYAGESRLLNYLNIVGVAIDSSQAVKDSVFAQLDRSSRLNNQFADQIILTTETVASKMDFPPIVSISHSFQNKMRLEPGETATIKIKIQNTGALPAHNVRLTLKTNDALRVNEADSLIVGSMTAGQESDLFTWTLNAVNSKNSKGIWDLFIYSDNAKTYSSGGSFSIVQSETPETGGKLKPDNIYNYPNPFNPTIEVTTLRYSLEKEAEVTINIYDAGGNLVKKLLNKEPQIAGIEQSVPWNGRNGSGDIVVNGVYFYTIVTNHENQVIGKIVVLR